MRVRPTVLTLTCTATLALVGCGGDSFDAADLENEMNGTTQNGITLNDVSCVKGNSNEYKCTSRILSTDSVAGEKALLTVTVDDKKWLVTDVQPTGQ